ncbi:sensor histidine kinase [Rhodococcus sp. RD6.2]|uniref:sensor histidine kinase n=1 Tax=Rhodococcus sp. RD6.2 TaxID=260936 RepID=UPI0006798829|nr:ATP-binding protein [Rhodococcus sp. RD6.2]
MSVRTGHENTDRILRMFARFVGVGYVAYLAILLPSITAMAPRLASWWTPAAVVTVFGSGITISLVSFRRDTRAIRITAGVAAAAFLLAAFTWPLAWIGPPVPGAEGVWLAGFPGLASIAAVIAWPTAVAFGHLVVGCVAVQLINYGVRVDSSLTMLVAEIAFAIMFCTLFVGGAAMAMRTGRILDSTTEQTHSAAATAAAHRARAVEQDRFAALTHDGVMATLLTASRRAPKAASAGLATATLRELDAIAGGVTSDQSFSAAATLAYLRAATAEADHDAAFRVSGRGTDDLQVPADVARTIASALAEALRNSHRHAGPSATSTVEVAVTERGIRVRVIDDGVGFDRSTVAPHRLGVTVSILGRMRQLPGGSAWIDSTPGHGTTVCLDWDAA